MEEYFFNRDISWLYFNERVLNEAASETVPLLERVKFLSIYSSNLDEFYRVRMPALRALEKVTKEKNTLPYEEAAALINRQQQQYGDILNNSIIPALQQYGYTFINNDALPESVAQNSTQWFYNQVAGFLQPVLLQMGRNDFFPENNQLYQLVVVQYENAAEQLYLVNIPVANVGRFYKASNGEGVYIIFVEDIIRHHLPHVFPGATIHGAWNIKITRDAELDLQDEYGEDLADKMEKQLVKRDYGFATRFLYPPDMPLRHLQYLVQLFNLNKASIVEGGRHHNLRDLDALPVSDKQLTYPSWAPAPDGMHLQNTTLLEAISERDRVIHAPYQSYDSILRFFNEAAMNPDVEEVYTTLYRVASNSRIAQALISAARNGKKVSVLVELKARFDEANNIRWAKKMKAAGVKILYSSNALKVHAKIALVKRKHATLPYLGLLATGNLNETTARFYTDHILLTAHQAMLAEMKQLFTFLTKRKKPEQEDAINFTHLLVAQFNLQRQFLALIDREIANAQQQLPAAITIKMNNLEEAVLIKKLYEASNAGVKITLIVRSICRLVPGIPGMSENITIKRIVDRYLEHGRVFIFHNNGTPEVYMGSADWMNRNIYRRIEVCFPVYDAAIQQQLQQIIALQTSDNVQAVWINSQLQNVPVTAEEPLIRSQEAIYQLLLNTTTL
ncbi:polyphosphate kinase [Filimonas lacunae]|uniref:Polyphosphate kinase n=1 Tax=Filimonas lacunae TaxID=477680 RepID=A0A173MK02_9BACT|nr:polyphosphate kinase 1 [Filimonas lacunae]BAV07796.1 polyphosphate kinase [Filimonas lacunae]SIT04879.1 polyphosphate kinase [Filimonas lacunae]